MRQHNLDQPSEPNNGEEHRCYICDACMTEDGGGDWVCNQYHKEDLMAQEEYARKMYLCPWCGSRNTENVELEPETNGTSLVVNNECKCNSCKSRWKEVYTFSRYEMIGTK
jgi:hypothetical protein